jgi:hypothetical protein
MRRLDTLLAAAAVAALALAGCGNSGSSAAPSQTPGGPPMSTPSPTPTPAPAAIGYDVLPCFFQVIPGTGGLTLAGLVVPDILTENLARPSGFPNGRRLEDPVVDITLAAIFLDLTMQSPLILHNIPLNPMANDVPLRTVFPYFAPPNGVAEPVSVGGSNFNFRTDPESAYTQVDRFGMPAVSTALITSSRKIPYNDSNPTVDANGDFVQDLADELERLTNGLADDFIAAGLRPCARPK